MRLPGFTAENCHSNSSEHAQLYNSINVRNASVTVPQAWGGRPSTGTPFDTIETICKNCVFCWRKCNLWGAICGPWRCSRSESCCEVV